MYLRFKYLVIILVSLIIFPMNLYSYCIGDGEFERCFGTLQTILLDENGATIDGAAVQLVNASNEDKIVYSIGAPTNYPDVLVGSYKLHFLARNVGFQDEWYLDKTNFQGADTIEIINDTVTSVNVTLTPLGSGSISGNVVNTNKEPIEFVHVSLQDQIGTRIEELTTDSLGYFSFDRLSDGIYQLAISHPAGCFSTDNLQNIEIKNENMVVGIEVVMEETETCTDNFSKGIVKAHLPDAEIPWYWFTYIPESLSKKSIGYIIVEPYASNLDDIFNATQNYQRIQGNSQQWSETLGFILIVPTIPFVNLQSETNNFSSMVFDFEVFSDETDYYYRRPDLKVNKIVKRLRTQLNENGYNVHSKIIITGGSASGSFSNRYTLLNPDMVLASFVGSPYLLTFPFESYLNPNSVWNGFEMDWMLGVANLNQLVGYSFDFDTYKKIPHLIVAHTEDNGNGVLPGRLDDAQIQFLNETFELEQGFFKFIINQFNYIKRLGANYTLKTYLGDHALSPEIDQQRVNDKLSFFTMYQDTDGDGVGNYYDQDDDNDGVSDAEDAFPLDPDLHSVISVDGGGGSGCLIETLIN